MLVNLIHSGLLFAERATVGRLPVATAGSSMPMLLGVAVGALVFMGLIVVVIQSRQRRHAKGTLNSPTELWAELCRVHQLDKNDSAALRELAAARAIKSAASLFVRADLWQLDSDTAQIRHLRPQLQRIQGILFAGSASAAQVVRL